MNELKAMPYVIVVNMQTLEAYTLDRSYTLIDERIQLKVVPYKDAVDIWFKWQCHATPEWAREQLSNMVAYWFLPVDEETKQKRIHDIGAYK